MSGSGDETTDFWNRCFREIDQPLNPVGKDHSDSIVAKFREHNVRSILDVGCGYGRWSIAFAQAGFDVTAVDVSVEAIRLLDQWARTLSLYVSTLVSDVRYLKDFDNRFDGIWCNSVLDHMTYADADRGMVNILRSLKPGGVACLSFDGQDNDPDDAWQSLDDGTRLYVSGSRKGMRWRFFSDQEIRLLVQDAKLLEFVISADGGRQVWIQRTGA